MTAHGSLEIFFSYHLFISFFGFVGVFCVHCILVTFSVPVADLDYISQCEKLSQTSLYVMSGYFLSP